MSDSKSNPPAASITLVSTPDHTGPGRRASDQEQPTAPANVVNVNPVHGALGFAGRAFTYANSTALVVLVVFFFRSDKRSEDNTTFLRESIVRQEARLEKDRDRADVRADAQQARLEAVAVRAEAKAEKLETMMAALSSEMRSMTNAVTALSSEVRAGKLKASADPREAAKVAAVADSAPLKQVYRETAPMPTAAAPGG